jgi:hypothetical protein
LGRNRPIDFQDVSETPPKPSFLAPAEKPDLIVDGGDLQATTRELRDLLDESGRLFDRGATGSWSRRATCLARSDRKERKSCR